MTETVEQEQTITLTPSAIRRAKAIMAKRGNPAQLYLRLGVAGGGCSGLQYVLDLDTEVTARDRLFEFDGVRVVVDNKSLRFLAGTELDFDLTNLLEGGFRFNNPNAKRGCGCGTSFQT